MKKTTLRNHNLPLSYYHNCNNQYYATVLEVTATISDHEHLSKPPPAPTLSSLGLQMAILLFLTMA